MKRAGSGPSSFVLAKGSGGTGDTGYSFVMSGSITPFMELSKSGEVSRLVVSGTPINDTNWHHIAGVHHRTGKGILYVGGVQKATGDITGYNVDLSNAQNLIIGSSSSGTTGFFGSIDDVRIYKSALLSSQIHQLYARGLLRHQFAFR